MASNSDLDNPASNTRSTKSDKRPAEVSPNTLRNQKRKAARKAAKAAAAAQLILNQSSSESAMTIDQGNTSDMEHSSAQSSTPTAQEVANAQAVLSNLSNSVQNPPPLC